MLLRGLVQSLLVIAGRVLSKWTKGNYFSRSSKLIYIVTSYATLHNL
jgi:hypothetical protein